MNSPSAVIPELPIVPDKDIPLSLYLFFPSPQEVGGWVNNLLLTGHTMTLYTLKFHRLHEKKKTL